MPKLRLPAEELYKEELSLLKNNDNSTKPKSWKLSPESVMKFIFGDNQLGIKQKFYGRKDLIEIAIASLISDRALLLVGEPGTAKSWLSELLTAAINGNSRSIIQGTSGTNEDQIKYSWNYAKLISEGYSENSLVKTPLFRSMENGSILRFEEITRIPSEIQDALISVLSEKEISIPELGTIINAESGFNIIATANTRDKGVNDMSSALKRRFNFVKIPVVDDIETEMQIVQNKTQDYGDFYDVELTTDEEILKTLVTIFKELREGKTLDKGQNLNSPSSVMSTAEIVSVYFNSLINKAHFSKSELEKSLGFNITNSVIQINEKDIDVLEEYVRGFCLERGGKFEEIGQSILDAISEYK